MLVHRAEKWFGVFLLAFVVCTSPSGRARSEELERVAPRTSFELDIQPILTAYGCNSGPCHGKARGQNGFKLSLLGFDSDFDFAALATQARGRQERSSPKAAR